MEGGEKERGPIPEEVTKANVWATRDVEGKEATLSRERKGNETAEDGAVLLNVGGKEGREDGVGGDEVLAGNVEVR